MSLDGVVQGTPLFPGSLCLALLKMGSTSLASGSTMKKGYRALVDEAMAEVKTYTLAQAQEKYLDPKVLFVDLRDIRELERDGTIPGAFSAPRGMIEFWIDPDSPYF
jgi:hypothetical protein